MKGCIKYYLESHFTAPKRFTKIHYCITHLAHERQKAKHNSSDIPQKRMREKLAHYLQDT